jgi:hypothetical protein
MQRYRSPKKFCPIAALGVPKGGDPLGCGTKLFWEAIVR